MRPSGGAASPWVVFQSSIGAELRHGAGGIDGLAGTEPALDALGIDVAHLRCGYFFTNLEHELESLRRGVLRVVWRLDAPMRWVAPRDVAEVAAAVLLDPGWSGRRVRAVQGPADLAWADVASILAAELSRPVVAERIGDEEMRARYLAAGMPAARAAALLGMANGLREGFVPEIGRTAATTTPTTLASWVHEVLRPSL